MSKERKLNRISYNAVIDLTLDEPVNVKCVVNLSFGGICLYLDGIPKNESVVMRFGKVSVKAMLRWSREVSIGVFAVGFSFDDRDDAVANFFAIIKNELDDAGSSGNFLMNYIHKAASRIG